MNQYLLDPVVHTCECKMLTPDQFRRLLTRLKSKKFGAKLLALDVDEITIKDVTRVENQFRERVSLMPGNYFNVHVEYVV